MKGGEPATTLRYDHIDALRAIAALLVVWRHAEDSVSTTAQSFLAQWVFPFVEPGRAGVILFFAISGFVIPSSLRGTLAEGTRTFLIRRFFRLYPAYWLSIPVGWVTLYLISNERIPWPTVLANATMLQEFFGYPHILDLYWTLTIELAFYAICLGLFWCGAVHRAVTFCAMIVFMAVLALAYQKFIGHMLRVEQRSQQDVDLLYRLGHVFIANPEKAWEGFMPFLYLSVMALGASLRFWHDRRADRLTVGFIACVLGYWAIFFVFKPLYDYGSGRLPLLQLHYCLSHGLPVIAFFLFACVWRIRSRIMSYLGVISYSTYLFHTIVAGAVGYLLTAYPDVAPRSLGGAYVILIMIASVALAALIFAYVERPAIEFGRRLTNTSVRRRVAVAASSSAPSAFDGEPSGRGVGGE